MQVKQWDTDYEKFYGEMDPKNIYKYPYSGLFYNPVIENGEQIAETYVYIPESATNSRYGVVILPDEGKDPAAFIEESGWVATADRSGVILIAAPYGYDLEKLIKVYGQTRNQRQYNINKAFRYVVAYGKSAGDGMKLAVGCSRDMAGIVCVGGTGLEAEYLKEEGNKESDRPYIPMKEVPLPVWILTDEPEKEKVVSDYWKHANQSEPVPYIRRGVKEFHPVKTDVNSGIDHQSGADFWISGYQDDGGKPFGADDFFEYFLSRTMRSTSIDNGDLNPVRSMEEWGAEFHTIEVDGYTREWYEYIPDQNRWYEGERLPLVVYYHGGSNQAWTNIQTTAWIKVAAARGFAVAFPSGTVRHREEDHAIPHPAWNAGMQSFHMDDMKFTRMMLADIESRYPIDRTRIYSSGHSMGACMAQSAALVLPDIFAACGVTGGVIRGLGVRDGFFGYYTMPEIKTDYVMPIRIVLGEHDTGGGTFETNPNAAINVEYWVERNQTQPRQDGREYTNGRYHHRIYQNQAGVPLIDFTTVKDKPHCFTPQDGWFFYDEWFSRYSRGADGTLYYMGIPVGN